MLLMSMLSLPQMIAETRYHRINRLMAASAAISVVCCIGGLFASCYIEVPCSALIVIIMAVAFAIAKTAAYVSQRRTPPGGAANT